LAAAAYGPTSDSTVITSRRMMVMALVMSGLPGRVILPV
jgi:hypothetical protein